jgi:hypothetical protein
VCSADTPDFVFLLEFTYFQKFLLFVFAVSAISLSFSFLSFLISFFTLFLALQNSLYIPELENLSVNETSSDELFSIDEVRKLLLGLNTTKSP